MKSRSEFHRRRLKSGNWGWVPKCKPCANKMRRDFSQTPAGKASNLANTRRWHARVKSASEVWRAVRGDRARADALRKALAADPPALDGEEALLAYWRGYIAGAKQSAEESERFTRYQDLAFRIAAEQDRKLGKRTIRLSYEDMVSVGYEAVLEMVRKKTDPDRALVAACIRRRYMDAARERFGRPGFGTEDKKLIWGYTGTDSGEDDALPGPIATAEAAVDLGAEERDLLERIRERLEESGRLQDPRLPQIVEWRLEGRTIRDVANRLGITESRVCQILKEARPWLEEHVLPLAESA